MYAFTWVLRVFESPVNLTSHLCISEQNYSCPHCFSFFKERYLTPLPALGCVAMSKSQTFLWCGCRLLKFTGQVSDNWNRMVSEQGFYTQTQHNGQGWTKTSNHLLNQATLSHYSTTQSLKYPHLYFSETAPHRHYNQNMNLDQWIATVTSCLCTHRPKHSTTRHTNTPIELNVLTK